MSFRDVYKNRAQAFAEFVAAQSLPVSRATFYADCGEYNLVQTDKTVRLPDLLGYVKEKLKLDPLSGQRLGEGPEERERARKMEDFEFRRAQAEVERLEKANRKDDERWMETAEHEQQMGALLGHVLEEQRQLKNLRLPELLYAKEQGAADFSEALDALLEDGLAAAVRLSVQAVTFDGVGGIEDAD